MSDQRSPYNSAGRIPTNAAIRISANCERYLTRPDLDGVLGESLDFNPRRYVDVLSPARSSESQPGERVGIYQSDPAGIGEHGADSANRPTMLAQPFERRLDADVAELHSTVYALKWRDLLVVRDVGGLLLARTQLKPSSRPSSNRLVAALAATTGDILLRATTGLTSFGVAVEGSYVSLLAFRGRVRYFDGPPLAALADRHDFAPIHASHAETRKRITRLLSRRHGIPFATSRSMVFS